MTINLVDARGDQAVFNDTTSTLPAAPIKPSAGAKTSGAVSDSTAVKGPDVKVCWTGMPPGNYGGGPDGGVSPLALDGPFIPASELPGHQHAGLTPPPGLAGLDPAQWVEDREAKHIPAFSPENARPLSPSEALQALTSKQLVELAQPDSIQGGISGRIRVDAIHGREKVPGLAELKPDARIQYLAVVQAPVEMKNGTSGPKLSDSTLFLTITPPSGNQYIVATKLKDGHFEGRKLFKNSRLIEINQINGKMKIFDGPRALVIRSWEGGVTPTNGNIGSMDGGFLVQGTEAASVLNAVKSIYREERKETLGPQAKAEDSAIAPTAKEVINAVRGSIMNALQNDSSKDVYYGLGWHGSDALRPQNGKLTFEVQNGPLKGIWASIHLLKVPVPLFESTFPGLTALNRERLQDRGMNYEPAAILSSCFVNRDVNAMDFLIQLARYRGVSIDNAVAWFNQVNYSWLNNVAAPIINQIEFSTDGTHRTTSKPPAAFPKRSFEDLARVAAMAGYPMPAAAQ
jgi:hypothetical protein